jgi:hypothetical protein
MGYYRNPEPGELEAIYREAWRDPTFSGRFAAGSTSQEIAASILWLRPCYTEGRRMSRSWNPLAPRPVSRA